MSQASVSRGLIEYNKGFTCWGSCQHLINYNELQCWYLRPVSLSALSHPELISFGVLAITQSKQSWAEISIAERFLGPSSQSKLLSLAGTDGKVGKDP